MTSKRIAASVPVETKNKLMVFSKQHGIDHSFIVQQAITKMSGNCPTEKDISYKRGETESIQVSLSDTAYQLLDLWSKQTGLKKSKLVTYALQKTIIENGGI